jgi:poly(3-hydroxybutyrate) depolymerase
VVDTYINATRSAHVYFPNRVSAPSPLLVTLHGGSLQGLAFLNGTQFAELSDSRSAMGLNWQSNTPTCRWKVPISPLSPASSFALLSNGSACVGQSNSVTNSQGFVLAMPNGLQDKADNSKRHWEDGRGASPGFAVNHEVRDDRAFISELIERLVLRYPDKIDPSRIYLFGVSNGGMMAQRIACSRLDTSYPGLARIAAIGASVSQLPRNLKDGTQGRVVCSADTNTDIPIILSRSKNFNTPQCSPYSFVCNAGTTGYQPPVSGDGVMPFGDEGSNYFVNSPDMGEVISAIDTQKVWEQRFAPAASARNKITGTFGYYTTKENYVASGSLAQLEILTVDGGIHSQAGNRFDYQHSAYIWNFLSGFSRANSATNVQTVINGIGGVFALP